MLKHWKVGYVVGTLTKHTAIKAACSNRTLKGNP